MPPPWPLRFSTLNICLSSLYPKRYAMRSLAADLLFNGKNRPPIREIFSYSPCCHVGTVELRSNVYFVGGLQPNFVTENPKSLHDTYILGKTVFAYNTAPPSPFTIVPDMISPKNDPLVLNVAVGGEERLYVLSDNMYPDICPPVFESYTLSTNSWEQLDPPPFLNPKKCSDSDTRKGKRKLPSVEESLYCRNWRFVKSFFRKPKYFMCSGNYRCVMYMDETIILVKSLDIYQILTNLFEPARKAWKTFTSKLQTKLHKLHKSKAITKKHHFYYSKNN